MSLLEMLKRPMEVQTEYRLVELLALLSQPVSAHYFLNTLEKEDAYLRMLAASTLGRLRLKEALPSLTKMLEDERLALRREAAIALGRLKLKQAGKPLVAALHVEAEPEVREQMLWALGMLNDRKNLAPLQGFLTHSSESTRWAAAKALLSMGELSGWKWLKPHLNSKEASECAYALLSLEDAVPNKSWKADALALLHRVMQEREATLAAQAAGLAARWGDKSAYVWLENKVQQSQNPELRVYEETLDKVRRVLASLPTPKEKRL
jgi:HEAT repeat protein